MLTDWEFEVIIASCFEPLPPHKQNVSLRGAGVDKNEGRGRGFVGEAFGR